MDYKQLKDTEIEATKKIIAQTEKIIDILHTDIEQLKEMLTQQREVLRLLKKIEADN
jgi:hypothetical protein